LGVYFDSHKNAEKPCNHWITGLWCARAELNRRPTA